MEYNKHILSYLLLLLLVCSFELTALNSIGSVRASSESTAIASPTNNFPATSAGWNSPWYAYDSADSSALPGSGVTWMRWYGYSFNIPETATITSVKIQLDARAGSPGDQGMDFQDVLKVQVGVGDATIYDFNSLALFDEDNTKYQAEVLLNGATDDTRVSYYVDVTAWTDWTPQKLDQIIVRLNADVYDMIRLCWVPVIVTYSSLSLGDITIESSVVPVGKQIAASVTFNDPDGGSHSAVWDWGDTADTGIVNEAEGTVTGSHTYNSAGVYSVKLTLSDESGSSNDANYNYVVVYDPTGGFVTGGGWIDSPAGAYTNDVSLAGKATFGFVSKYAKGAPLPSGNTEFQFNAAGINFKSTCYDWLVVANSMAQYQGAGTVNGESGYPFHLWATQGSKIDPDCCFRIQISDSNGEVIYDNGFDGGVNQPISGGSIVVHK